MSCQRCPFCYQMLWPWQTIKYSCNLRAQTLIKYFSLLSWCFQVSLIWTTRRRGILFFGGGGLYFLFGHHTNIIYWMVSNTFSYIFIEYQAGPYFLFFWRNITSLSIEPNILKIKTHIVLKLDYIVNIKCLKIDNTAHINYLLRVSVSRSFITSRKIDITTVLISIASLGHLCVSTY